MTCRLTTLILTSALILGIAGCAATLSSEAPPPKSAAALPAKPPITKFKAYTQRFAGETLLTQGHATGHVGDLFFTHWKDGGEASFKLDEQGRFKIDWIGGDYNYVGGPGWESGDRNRVIGYRLNEDAGASYVTLYGWGYDKDMDPADPAHLVEYYIIQRWVRTPAQGGEQGVTFTSNGVDTPRTAPCAGKSPRSTTPRRSTSTGASPRSRCRSGSTTRSSSPTT